MLTDKGWTNWRKNGTPHYMATPSIRQLLATLPAQPGVYQFKNARGEILYVGKAKSLRSRVRSYFQHVSEPRRSENDTHLAPAKDLDPAKTELVSHIADIETIVVDSENEALILEANLIRQHQPPYNVVLRDDKYYLFIKITNEAYPRVYPVRKISRDGARYFGPYSSAASVRRTLKLLRRIFPYREEKESPRDQVFPHPLFAPDQPKESTPESPRTTQRLLPTTSYLVPATNYQENITQIIRFLKGDRAEIITTLRRGMRAAATAHNFEQAGIWRDQLHAIERLEGDQKVFLPRPESFDVVSIATNHRSAANVFQIRGGKLLGKHTFLLRHKGSALAVDVLRQFLLQYYRDAQDIPNLILIPAVMADADTIATYINRTTPPTFYQPARGKKRQLLTMGTMNAEQLLRDEEIAFATDARLQTAVQQLGQTLGINEPLHRIETYDISNIQGKYATGSMIVFTDGKPDTSQYRKFRITSEDTPDDFRMMREVLQRRFSATHTDWKLPQLILIDGGKGQLSAAMRILNERGITLPIAALAKQEEELFLPNQVQSIKLPYDSDALYLVQRMRDEAHRFVLTYHRLLRSKQSKRSLLDEIPGIGPKLKKKLLNRFGSLKGIRAASDEELIAVLGEARTKTLQEYL